MGPYGRALLVPLKGPKIGPGTQAACRGISGGAFKGPELGQPKGMFYGAVGAQSLTGVLWETIRSPRTLAHPGLNTGHCVLTRPL